jgi:hypothetical protein
MKIGNIVIDSQCSIEWQAWKIKHNQKPISKQIITQLIQQTLINIFHKTKFHKSKSQHIINNQLSIQPKLRERLMLKLMNFKHS